MGRTKAEEKTAVTEVTPEAKSDQEPPLPSMDATPPDPEEGVPVALTLAEHYAPFGVQQLAEASLRAETALREVEQALASADSWLNDAIKLDEREFSEATGGPEVAASAPHYAAAQQRLAGLIPKRWALQRRATALALAARLARLVELEQATQKRHPEIASLEERVQKMQEELNMLRYAQQAAQNEKREIGVTKHEEAEYRRLAAGPQVRGLAAALLGQQQGAKDNWSPHRIVMTG